MADEGIKAIAIFLVRLMKAYGFHTKDVAYHYPATSMDNALLRAIEGVYFYGDAGYIYVAGRNSNEYATGGDRSLAIRWDGSRPNMSYLAVTYGTISSDYFNTLRAIDLGGGFTDETWIEPEEIGGKRIFKQRSYNYPIDENIYIGVMYRVGELPKNIPPVSILLQEVVAKLLGNFILSNYNAPDRDIRYNHLIRSIRTIYPSMTIVKDKDGIKGHKVPYFPLRVILIP